MASCKNCIHYEACDISAVYFGDITGSEKFREYENRTNVELDCDNFKDRSKFIELPYEPIPIVNDGTGFNSDCYCPKCGVNLSGCYADGTEEPLNVIQCYNCGLVCDNTKTIAKESAEQALKERENNANT